MKFQSLTSRGTEYIDMFGIQDDIAFTPNFGGDASRNRFGSDAKNFRVQLKTPEDVQWFRDHGIKIGEWTPKPSEDDPDPEPVYTVNVAIDFRHPEWYPVEVHLADKDGSNDYILPENQMGKLDKIYDNEGFYKMDVEARVRKSKGEGAYTLYVRYAWFYQNENEFMQMHQRVVHPEESPAEEPDVLPFS